MFVFITSNDNFLICFSSEARIDGVVELTKDSPYERVQTHWDQVSKV